MRRNQFFGIFFLVVGVVSLAYGTNTLAIEGVRINHDDSRTLVRRVTLSLYPPAGMTQMKISNDVNFINAAWEPMQNEYEWMLESNASEKTVFVEFRNAVGVRKGPYTDKIYLSVDTRIAGSVQIDKNALKTATRHVTLSLSYSQNVDSMRISNSNDFSGLPYQKAVQSVLWTLSPLGGAKTVFVEFQDAAGKTVVAQDGIQYEQPANYIPEGSRVKGQSDTIYYYGYDGKLHPFLHSAIYHSWYDSFTDIEYVSDAKIREFDIGMPMCVRPGTWLVQFGSDPRLYAPEFGCELRVLRSDAEADVLYGKNWRERVVVFPEEFSSIYAITDYRKRSSPTDRDGDGLEKDAELTYRSSDYQGDTDKDGLSDYEEVMFWFTDPSLADTDSDGVADGVEAGQGDSPFGFGKAEQMPGKEAYPYPKGSLITRSTGRSSTASVFVSYDGNIYTITKKGIDDNAIQRLFAISSGPAWVFDEKKAGTIKGENALLRFPVQKIGSKYEAL